ncbi:hypothetical protein J1N35_014473 [Gossypium stocksii]|uniref:Uncharacterized protein n=1 Tax=Gossypium stocksii TaxID=47602 RepID=A0A9D4A9Y5_9ROSI|nr:hypothetical protein J1N35_014473 [Gossypium stocksii]
MSPRQTKQTRSQLNPPLPLAVVLKRFTNKEVENYFMSIQGQMFILEHGFNPTTSLCNEIWDLVYYHGWFNFCLVPKPTVVILVVLEFYENLKVYVETAYQLKD